MKAKHLLLTLAALVLAAAFLIEPAGAQSLGLTLPDLGTGLLLANAAAAIDLELLQKAASKIQSVADGQKKSDEKVADIERHNLELSARLQGVEQLVVGKEYQAQGVFVGTSLGRTLVENIDDNSAFQSLKEWNSGTVRLKAQAPLTKALVNEGASPSSDGFIPSNPERVGIVGPVLRPLRLLDVLQSRPTTSDSVEFVQLSTTGDVSEQIHEGDEKASLDFDGVLKRAEIVTIAGHTAASRQVLADHTALAAQIDRVLRGKVLGRLEHQILNGAGGQGEIHGLIDQATAFTPTLSTTPADAIGEAVTELSNAGYVPGLIVMHPLDWFGIQITKTQTEEAYQFGSPTAPIPPMLWNLPVVVTSSMPQGSALVMDLTYATVLDRQSPSVLVSNSHADFFVRNLIALLGELRAGLELLDTGAVLLVDLAMESSGS